MTQKTKIHFVTTPVTSAILVDYLFPIPPSQINPLQIPEFYSSCAVFVFGTF